MATEEGIVVRIDSEQAWVKTTKTGACESCSARSSCAVLGGGKEMEVNALNTAGAKIDDRVVMSFETGSLLKATFLLYIVPILAMLAGAIVGQVISAPSGFDPSVGSPLAAFLFLAIAVFYVRLKGNKLGKQNAYRPKIIRVLN